VGWVLLNNDWKPAPVLDFPVSLPKDAPKNALTLDICAIRNLA